MASIHPRLVRFQFFRKAAKKRDLTRGGEIRHKFISEA